MKLPSANVKPGGKVEVDAPADDGDLNDQYEAEISIIAKKKDKEVKTINPAEKQEDYYKGFRSAVVLFWMFSNLALAAVVLSTAGLERLTPDSGSQRTTIYLAVVLWSVAGLSLFRFIGAMWFLVVRLVSRVFYPYQGDSIILIRSFIFLVPRCLGHASPIWCFCSMSPGN